MVTINKYNINGEITGSLNLPQEIEKVNISIPLLHEVVRYYLANRRQGTVSTKTRGEVSGGGRKPWRQKHTGRARHGSIRSPIWVGGGVTFGPKMRDYSFKMPKKKLRKALKMAIKSKARDGELLIVEDFTLESHKTKEFKKIAEKLALPRKTLMVVNNVDKNLKLASSNLKINVKNLKDINTYEIIDAKKVVFTESAFKCL